MVNNTNDPYQTYFPILTQFGAAAEAGDLPKMEAARVALEGLRQNNLALFHEILNAAQSFQDHTPQGTPERSQRIADLRNGATNESILATAMTKHQGKSRG